MNSLKRWRLWCAVPVVFILLFIISIYTFSKKNVKEYERTEEVFGNPLMGYAPCAWNTTVSDDVSLLYMDITWAELEPEEGQYNWESIDKRKSAEPMEEGRQTYCIEICL